MVMKKVIVALMFVLLAANFASAKEFEPTWDSLSQNYQCPDWFRDAKFGIFMHWGIISGLNPDRTYTGSHYGRYMYGEGEFSPGHKNSKMANKLRDWHREHYGDPLKVGYKDLIKYFKAEKFDSDELVKFYKEIGARYIVPVAIHHDNFAIYDTKLSRWNSVNMGPKKDLLAMWKKSAEKYGLRFGVSNHLYRSPSFFQVSRKFDGGDPKYADFYCSNYDINFKKDDDWNKLWYERTKELVDNYQPDLLYFDGALPGTSYDMTYGLELASYFYNTNMKNHNGKLQAVLNLKKGPSKSAFIWDIEKGQSGALQRYPWQTDTCLIGSWFYRTVQKTVFSPDVAIGNLVDIVSKNGNLLLNVGLKGDGTLPEMQRVVLREMGKWLKVNGEAIYGSRPWIVYGEGPTKVTSGTFKQQRSPYTSKDIRFTTNDGYLYAIAMGIPEKEVTIKSLSSTLTLVNNIENISLLGSDAKLKWKRTADALVIQLPEKLPCDHALAFKIKVDESSNQMWELIIE